MLSVKVSSIHNTQQLMMGRPSATIHVNLITSACLLAQFFSMVIKEKANLTIVYDWRIYVVCI